MLFARLLLSVVVAAPLAAQQTFVIQSGDYYGIRIAVAMARPGDTLIVQAGRYAAPVIEIGITMLCEPGVDIGDMFGGLTVVQNLPVGQRLVVRGGHYFVGHARAGLLIRNCAGAVVFEAAGNSNWLFVEDSAHVVFNGCALSEIQVRASRLVIAGGTVTGLLYPSIQIFSGDVTIHGCDVVGASLFFQSSAIELARGTLTLADGDTLITTASPAHAAITTQGGTIRRDPNVRIESAVGPITGPATVLTEPIPAVHADGQGAGQTFTGTTHAPAGDLAYTFASWIVPPMPTPLGTLWLDPVSPVLDAGTVPATGQRTYSSVVPTLPRRGLPMVLQPISIGANGVLRVGAPVTVVLD